MALAVGSAAQAATNLLVNGGFEASSYEKNSQFGSGYGGQGVTGWTGGSGLQEYFFGGTHTTVSANNQWSDPRSYFWPSFNALSNNGGNFVALDGDTTVSGSISQTLSNLQVGKTYTLTFEWAAAQLANRIGDITEQLKVSFGDEVQYTSILPVASQGFSGWQSVKMFFTPTAGTQTLTFLSLGTPNGLPPMAVLDGASLTVPEPGTWAMMLLGFGAIGFAMRRRKRGVSALA
jgi:hypothetical protein